MEPHTGEPAAARPAYGALRAVRLLTLRTALIAITVSLLAQTGLAYGCCLRRELAPGASDPLLFRPLGTYGLAQLATLAPATLHSELV